MFDFFLEKRFVLHLDIFQTQKKGLVKGGIRAFINNNHAMDYNNAL